MKAKVALAFLPLVSIVLAACSSSQGPAGGTPKDTLVIAAAATPQTLDGEFGSTGFDWEVAHNVYRGLLVFQLKTNSNGTREGDLSKAPVCNLCVSYAITPDSHGYQFVLKPGVMSSYGNELTSADVQFALQRAAHDNGGGVFATGAMSIDPNNPVTVTGKYTFVINQTQTNPVLPVNMVTTGNGPLILDSTEVKKHVTASDPLAKLWLASHVAGFGPYKVTSFVPGQQVTYEAIPNYPGYPAGPAIKKVIYRAVPDGGTRLALLNRGEVDVATGLNALQIKQLQGKSGVAVDAWAGNLGMLFGMNNKVKPFDNVKVRQAIAYGLPDQEIISSVYQGLPGVQLAAGYEPASFPGALDAWPYPENVAKAKQLLSEAGTGPISFTLDYNATNSDMEAIAVLVQTRMKDLGITVTLSALAPAQYQQQYFTRKAQAVIVYDASFTPDGPYSLILYFDSKVGEADWANYEDSTVNTLLSQASGTVDSVVRAQLSRQAHEIIAAAAPWGFYIQTGYFVGRRTNVTGFAWRPSNAVEFIDMSKN